MIIVKLMGGLGNQMFQYAVARRLAWRHGTPLKMDFSFLEGEQTGNTPRIYALDTFRISAEKASQWEITYSSGKGNARFLSGIARLLQRAARYTSYREHGFQFHPKLLSLSDKVYLEGYWQSEKYFTDITDIIRDEFTFITPAEGINYQLAQEISSVNSVSLHVRRGDYVTDRQTSEVHGICDGAYYVKAVEEIARAVKDPCFYIFSDDPEWVRKNLKLQYSSRYICHNGTMANEDLRLMSLCKHHVIANSSFSWWGAWLSANCNKIVMAPDRWFRDPGINTCDLIPESWVRI